jgi:hypothetical protein
MMISAVAESVLRGRLCATGRSSQRVTDANFWKKIARTKKSFPHVIVVASRWQQRSIDT